MALNFFNPSTFEKIKHPEISFPLKGFYDLLTDLGAEPSEWIDFWITNSGETLASSFLAPGTKLDWIWGLALPFLSDIRRSVSKTNSRKLFGISALPGCGKTSFGKWLEEAAKEFNISVKVISMDDFYLPSKDLQLAMKDNPWNVPRGLPGSHSISLLEDAIDHWKKTGHLISPQFDKALRKGLGDRSGWLECYPQVLVLEGWFLGCYPLNSSFEEEEQIRDLHPNLTDKEKVYREKVQNLLYNYLPIWERIERLWHIKSVEFSATCHWKIEQEKQMLKDRGSALEGDALNSFVRMIQASIPQQSLLGISCDALVEIEKSRRVISVSRQFRDPLFK